MKKIIESIRKTTVVMAMLVLLMFSLSVMTAQDLAATMDGPSCDGKTCTDKDDCGSKCYCNNPFKCKGCGTCFVDASVE